VSQSSGDTLQYMPYYELDSVFNFGLGFDYEFSPALAAFGSFVTDFSAYVPGDPSNLATTTWDIYHLTGGADFTFKHVALNLGVGYSFGSQRLQRSLELDEETGTISIVEAPGDAEVKWRRIKFILGFAFNT
jgi:hypothetical protein